MSRLNGRNKTDTRYLAGPSAIPSSLSLSWSRPREGRRENRSERRSADGNRRSFSLSLFVCLSGSLAGWQCVWINSAVISALRGMRARSGQVKAREQKISLRPHPNECLECLQRIFLLRCSLSRNKSAKQSQFAQFSAVFFLGLCKLDSFWCHCFNWSTKIDLQSIKFF